MIAARARLGARVAPDGHAIRDEIRLALAYLGLVALVVGLSLVGASAVGRILYMGGAVAFCVVTRRRSPWLLLSATLWFWLGTAFVRRLLEWHTPFVASDLVLGTPNIMTAFIALDVASLRGLFTRRGSGYGLLLLGCAFYGLTVSFLHGQVLGGLFAAADWIGPIFYLFYFIGHADRIEEAEPHVRVFLTLSLLVIVPYTLYQFFVMPSWDADWMVGSGMGAVGNPLPEGSRVFGPTNSPQFLAVWLGTCLVFLSYFRNTLLLLLAPVLLTALAIAQVRSVYGSTVLALLVGALLGRGGVGRLATMAGFAVVAILVGLVVLDSNVLDQLGTRFSSFGHLSNDGSAQVRAEIIGQTPIIMDQHPFGMGIGGQGRGLAAESTSSYNINIDFGPLSVYIALGWLVGTVYIVGLLLLQMRVLQLAKRWQSPIGCMMAAAALCPLATFPSINVLQFPAVVMWICFGYVLAIDIRNTALARPGPVSWTRAPAGALGAPG